jgi:prevent-host-death family protein
LAKQVNVYEAKTKLSQLLDEAVGGEDIVIARAGRPLVRLVPVEQSRKPRKPGGWKGKVWTSDDFDDPLPDDIQAALEGRGD